METKGKPFFGGVPTEPDVLNIEAAYPDMQEGDIVKHEELEAIIKQPRTASRYRTVVTAWRRKVEREHNQHLKAVPTVGYEVATPKQRVEISGSRYTHGIRRIVSAGSLAMRTPRQSLPDEDKRVLDHLTKTAGMIKGLADTQAKALRYPDPVKAIE